MYTTVIHEVRRILDISILDYCYCDLIYHLSNNPKSKNPGWATISHSSVGLILGISKQSVITLIKRLEKKELLITEGQFKKVTQKWYNAVYNFDLKTNRSIKEICCYYCGISIIETKLEVEHYIPISRGGNDDSINLVLSCSNCNKEKGTLTGDEYLKYKNQHTGKETLPDSGKETLPDDGKETLPYNNKLYIENKEIYNKEYSKDSEVNTAFIEYLQLRKKMKLDNTERIIKRLLSKLHEYASNKKEALEIIEKAITTKWKDFYPLKGIKIKKEDMPRHNYKSVENYIPGYDR